MLSVSFEISNFPQQLPVNVILKRMKRTMHVRESCDLCMLSFHVSVMMNCILLSRITSVCL